MDVIIWRSEHFTLSMARKLHLKIYAMIAHGKRMKIRNNCGIIRMIDAAITLMTILLCERSLKRKREITQNGNIKEINEATQ